jgi:hypothetical protein
MGREDGWQFTWGLMVSYDHRRWNGLHTHALL